MTRALPVALAAASLSCGGLATQGTAASYLIVESIEAAAGPTGDFRGFLESDVSGGADDEATVVQDVGRVTFVLALKDPGPAGAPVSPSQANAITLDRYRVRYVRADGRNQPGIDVPYAFDGALTLTIFDRSSAVFPLVRAQAKAESPLAALAGRVQFLSTLAEITFFGRDQSGREVVAVGSISVHFGDWPDQR